METDKENKEKNEKTVFSTMKKEVPELHKKIKSQIEFYFGDRNLPKDIFLVKYLLRNDGWVPMTVMLRFRVLAALSRDIDTILEAISDSELMEISADRKQIRRRADKPPPIYQPIYKKAQAELGISSH